MPHDSARAGLSAVIRPDGSAELTVDETPQEIPTTLIEDARREIVRRTAEIAALLGGPVQVVVHEPDGDWPLLVHPDGRVDSDEGSAAPVPADADETPDEDDEVSADTVIRPAPARSETRAEDTPSTRPTAVPTPAAPAATPVPPSPVSASPAPASPISSVPLAAPVPAPAPAAAPPAPAVPAAPVSAAPVSAAPTPAAPAPTPGAPGPAPLRTANPAPAQPGPSRTAPAAPPEPSGPEERRSFLAAEQDAEELATRGWRGALVRTGMRVPPGSAERAERADQTAVAQHWFGPRTIAVVNGKGGAGKTPTTILTAAVFARFGGAGVLAWDNNQTRGTLGWRTEQGPHEATLHELLPETDRLLSADAQAADLARFVHHQTRDRFDVLRSKPMVLAEQQRIHSDDVDRIHAVASKYYRLIVMDSGNDESDPMWLRMIDHSDQIVVATTSRAEHAEAGALLLEALASRDARSARLAQNAVAVVSQADPNASTTEHRKVVDGYRALARDVVSVPYDPAMIGGLLHYGALKPATQRAWLAAGAAIARGLGPAGG